MIETTYYINGGKNKIIKQVTPDTGWDILNNKSLCIYVFDPPVYDVELLGEFFNKKNEGL